jgi:hypothetical protein
MLATLALRLLPPAAVRAVNRALNATLRRRETVAFRTDYS